MTSSLVEDTGIMPEALQDNIGAYALQAGDTLEHIALHVYRDSSLWYLLADANGISDRNAQAGNGQLHIGQRLNIPPAASDQHHTNGTHKVLNANQMIGSTTASNLSPPSPQKKAPIQKSPKAPMNASTKKSKNTAWRLEL